MAEKVLSQKGERSIDLGLTSARLDVQPREGGRSSSALDSSITSDDFALKNLDISISNKSGSSVNQTSPISLKNDLSFNDLYIPPVRELRAFQGIDAILDQLGVSELRLYSSGKGEVSGLWMKSQDGSLQELSHHNKDKFFKYSISGSKSFEDFTSMLTGGNIRLGELSAYFEPEKGKLSLTQSASFEPINGTTVSIHTGGNRPTEYRLSKQSRLENIRGESVLELNTFSGTDGGIIANIEMKKYGSFFFDTGSPRGNIVGYSLASESSALKGAIDFSYGQAEVKKGALTTDVKESVSLDLSFDGKKDSWIVSGMLSGKASKGGESEPWAGELGFMLELVP